MQVFTHCRVARLITQKFLLLALLLNMAGLQALATAWTTSVAGPISVLSNWSDGGSGAPTSFTTPGDTWTINLAMTMSSSSATWTVGTASAAPVTVTFASGGSLSPSGAGGTFNITVYGAVDFSGGNFSLGGAGTTCNFNTYGPCTMSAGSLAKSGAGAVLNFNVYGNYTISGGTVDMGGSSGSGNITVNGNYAMTGGTTISGGAGGALVLNVLGNYSMSGGSAMTNTGAGTSSTVHLKLPSGTMMIDNTSTGTWSKTVVYIDSFCTAQLAGNFSTSTGTLSGGYGLLVQGTLKCPAAYVVNGTAVFKLTASGSLHTAHPSGIDGSIVTTGTATFDPQGSYTFYAAAPQVTGFLLPGSLSSPSVLTINNSAGVTLSAPVVTTGTLALTSGVLHTISFSITTPGTASGVTGGGTGSYVDGILIKTIAGCTTVNYEVGDLSYAPMSLALSPAGTGGSLGIRTTNGIHAGVATSGLTASNMVNHYWSISNYSAAGPTTVDPTATYFVGDILGGSNTLFLTQEYASGAWLTSPIASTNTATPYTTSPNTAIPLGTVAGDYIFGNLYCGTLPITGTSTLCAGANTTLSSATSGGSWSSGTPSVATVSSTGVVTGVAGGTAIISYTASGCTVTSVVTVTPLPSAGTITGPGAVCITDTIYVADTATGGTWSSTSPTIASVSSTGMVIGLAVGIDTIVYTVTNTCGSTKVKKVVTVVSAAACAAGVAELSHSDGSLSVFPDPSKGSFTLRLSLTEEAPARIIITDIVGRIVLEQNIDANRPVPIALQQPPGIYLISAITTSAKYVAKLQLE